jgi:ATP synthase protein I
MAFSIQGADVKSCFCFNIMILKGPYFRNQKVFMKRETRRQIKELAYYSSIGLSISLSIFIGLALGVYLDRHVFDTTPWFTIIFLILGVIAGYRNIGLAIKKAKKLE